MSSSTSPSCGTRHLRQGWQLKQTEVGKFFDGGPNTGAPAVSPQNPCLWCVCLYVDCIPDDVNLYFLYVLPSYLHVSALCISVQVSEKITTLRAKALSTRTETILTHTQRKNAYYLPYVSINTTHVGFLKRNMAMRHVVSSIVKQTVCGPLMQWTEMSRVMTMRSNQYFILLISRWSYWLIYPWTYIVTYIEDSQIQSDTNHFWTILNYPFSCNVTIMESVNHIES